MIDFGMAREFVLRNARLLDRRRFAFLFEAGPVEPAVTALLAYRNADGGFGNGLEPDIRCEASQPVPVEQALHTLAELGTFTGEVAHRCCAWLETVTTSDGGVPFAVDGVEAAPHAPWWQASAPASLNPTAGIVGLLRAHAITHPWIERAKAFCWRALEKQPELGPDDAVSVLRFLESSPTAGEGADRVAEVFSWLGRRIRDELTALDPETPGYVKTPLAFAPAPGSIARRLYDSEDIELHLDALERRQDDDGGWPITWEPPGPIAVCEWRSIVTIESLVVLRNYGRSW